MAFSGKPLTCFDSKTRKKTGLLLLRDLYLNRANHLIEQNDRLPNINRAKALKASMPPRQEGEDIYDWLERGFADLSEKE